MNGILKSVWRFQRLGHTAEMFLAPDCKCWDKALIKLGPLVIDTTLQVITKKELSNASDL